MSFGHLGGLFNDRFADIACDGFALDLGGQIVPSLGGRFVDLSDEKIEPIDNLLFEASLSFEQMTVAFHGRSSDPDAKVYIHCLLASNIPQFLPHG